jgi:lysophospholipase L1-like esterase
MTLSVMCVMSLLGAIVCAEYAAQLMFPELTPAREERVKFWVYDDLLGWAHMPNQRAQFNHRDFSVEVLINSHGFRDGEYSIERTAKKRMFVLGDSFGWGFGVEQQERFSEIIENAHDDWEVINASVSGYGTDQLYLSLKRQGLKFKPDAVMLLFYENDFENNIAPVQYWHSKPVFTFEDRELQLHNVPVPKQTISQRLEQFLVGRTYLGRTFYRAIGYPKKYLKSYLKNGLEFFGARISNSSSPLSDRLQSNNDNGGSGQKKMIEVTKQLIISMNDLCKREGSVLILVSIPMETEKREVLQSVAEAQGIPILFLDETFEAATTPTTFAHDAHWNAEGHKLAAGAIEEFFWKSGRLDELLSHEKQREERKLP